MAGPADNEIFAWIRGSAAYKALDPKDRAKVDKALSGLPSTRPASLLGRAAWALAKRLAPTKPVPPPPPPPPPATYVRVAPRTYNYAPSNNSDPRFCWHGQPGCVELPNGDGTDESGAIYDSDCRERTSVRTRYTQVPGLRQADNSDGKGPCELYDGLTAWPGDPTKNTGSWAI